MIFLSHFVSLPPIFVDDVDALWYPFYSMRNTIHEGKRYTAAAAPADNKMCMKMALKMISFFFSSLRRFCPFFSFPRTSFYLQRGRKRRAELLATPPTTRTECSVCALSTTCDN